MDEASSDRPRVSLGHVNNDYAELARVIQSAGLMKRRYGYYWTKLVVAPLACVVCLVLFVWLGDTWWQLLTAVLLAFVFTQIAFLGHDAAHRQIFRSGKWNDWVTVILGDLFTGMSYGWWQNKHTLHHAEPNRVGVDPDIDMHVVAMTPEQFHRFRNPVTRWLIAHQGWYFFPIMCFEGVALHVASLRRVFGRQPLPRRSAEIALLLIRLGGYLALVFLVLSPVKALVFLVIQLGLFGFYMGMSFAPNHKGMPLIPKTMKLDFLRRQVLMSRNIRGTWVVSFAMGGLNYQIEHHLFPSMPRPHLRRAAPIIAEFCRAREVAYTETGLWESYGIVRRYINSVGLGQKDPFVCPLVAQRRGD